ncbi:MAG: hypothetical protein RR284_05435, partial [Ruthenibacterium sp.]
MSILRKFSIASLLTKLDKQKRCHAVKAVWHQLFLPPKGLIFLDAETVLPSAIFGQLVGAERVQSENPSK